MEPMKCNGPCKNTYARKKLKLKRSQVIVDKIKQKDKHNREIVRLVTVVAWRGLCESCGIIEEQQEKKFKEVCNLDILDVSSTAYAEFVSKYHEIADRFGLASGCVDKYKQPSPYADTPREFSYGQKYVHNTLDLFVQEAETFDDEEKKKGDNHNSNSNSNEHSDINASEHSAARKAFTADDLITLAEWIDEQKFGGVTKMETVLKDKGYLQYLKEKGIPVRKDEKSYARLWDKAKKGEHALQKPDKPDGADLKKKCVDVEEAILKRKTEKFNIGDDASSSLNDAKSGVFAVKKKKNNSDKEEKDNDEESPTDPLKVAYGHHSERENAKKSYNERQLDVAEKNAQAIACFGTTLQQIALSNLSDRDYLAAFKEYVRNEYSPQSERMDILRMCRRDKEAKEEFTDLWRAVMANQQSYTLERKNSTIKGLYDEFSEENNDERSRSRSRN